MSFLTCFCDLPQKEHFSRSPPSPIRATDVSPCVRGPTSPSRGDSALHRRYLVGDRNGRPPTRCRALIWCLFQGVTRALSVHSRAVVPTCRLKSDSSCAT